MTSAARWRKAVSVCVLEVFSRGAVIGGIMGYHRLDVTVVFSSVYYIMVFGVFLVFGLILESVGWLVG